MKQYTFKDGFKCVAYTKEEAIAQHKVVAKIKYPYAVRVKDGLPKSLINKILKDKQIKVFEWTGDGSGFVFKDLKSAQKSKELISDSGFKATLIDASNKSFTDNEVSALKKKGFSSRSDDIDEGESFYKKNFINIKGLFADIYKTDTNKYKVQVFFDNEYDDRLPGTLTYFNFTTDYIVKDSLRACFDFFDRYEKIIKDVYKKNDEIKAFIDNAENQIESLR